MNRLSRSLWIGVLALGFALTGCGDDTPTVEITEADPVAERHSLAPDDTSALVDSTRADTLETDSVEVVAADTAAAIPPPDFDAFWIEFQAAVRSGNVGAVTRYAKLGEEGIGLEDIDQAYIKAFTEPFKSAVLSLSPRDFERDETARKIRVVVGFDENGRVVPEDEADRDRAIQLQFDVVNGRYRWTGFREES